MSASPVSPLAADTSSVSRPPRSVVVATVLGRLTGAVLGTALVIYVSVVWLLGIDLSFEQFVGATILGMYLSA